ncbi:hypothetical protein ARMGADRAFT_460603 [Armillaria gallica]|uniref:Uncharacterized protein n=1 Tax=Armillaria gallica TaxID=47427 RepID=A0A2H3D0H8_ARMGA|nr:hypothetical protein ARMGADRAFT_460603 [Armillaria gallica]
MTQLKLRVICVLKPYHPSLHSHIALPLPLTAVPPFLQGPHMTPEVFKCLEVWWASKYKDRYNSSFNDLKQLKVWNVFPLYSDSHSFL